MPLSEPNRCYKMRQLTRLIALLLLLGPLRLSAQTKLITLSMKDQPLKEVIRSIASQTGYNVVVSEKILAEARKISVEVKDVPLEKALQECFRKTDLSCSVVEGTIIITKKAEVIGTTFKPLPVAITVGGRITNDSGTPLAGATITARGKTGYTFSVQTDDNGRYSFVADANVQLTFSFVDYKTQTARVKETNTELNITLEKNDKAMETVTISTGYQRIERKYLTGSVTSLKMDSVIIPGVSTVDKMLEGRVPGMTYMLNSGQAGAVPRLRVRGTSTYLGSQEPLWVVDGIVRVDPVNIPANKINDLDFVNLIGNAISGINPNDIEQIDVLKDAAATALYGVRAANGVIVITTKRGKPGPPTVKYDGNVSLQRRPRYTDRSVYMMNSMDRVAASRELIEKQLAFNGVPVGYEKAILDYYNGNIDYDTYIKAVNKAETVNTDWLGIITQDVVKTMHNLSVSGGNQVSRYIASIGFSNDPGVTKGEFYKRYNASIGFDVDYKKFRGRIDLITSKTDKRYTPAAVGILDYAYGTSRAIPLHNDDGSLYFYPTRDNRDSRLFLRPSMNVVNEMNRTGNTVDGSETMLSASAEYELLPELVFRGSGSYSFGNTEQETWFEEKTNYMDKERGRFYGDPQQDPAPFGGELQQSTTRMKNYVLRGELQYTRFLDNRNLHMLNVLTGAELSSAKHNSIDQARRGYYPERGYTFAAVSPFDFPGYATWMAQNRATIMERLSNLASIMASATYIYNDRYVITLQGRSDYSNSFGNRSNEKFLPNWSISGRWNMQNDLFRNSKSIDLLALTLSYGTRGNILANQTPYTIIKKDLYNSIFQDFMSFIQAYPNPNLNWEKTSDYNIGLAFSLFKNKLTGSVAYFYKRTTNTFVTKKVSQMNGIMEYVVNGGIMENKGVEVSLNYTPVQGSVGKDGKRGFTWRIDPQLGQVFNRLISSAINNRNSALIDPRNITYEQYLNGSIVIDGKAINTFYSYRFKGLDNTGLPVFYGAELENAAELKEKYSKMDRESVMNAVMVESGRRIPVLQGGVSNYFSYRNWGLSMNITYSVGNKIRLLQLASGRYSNFRPSSQQNLRQEFVNRWRYPGDELYTNIPGLNGSAGRPLITDGSGSSYNGPVFAQNYYQMYDFSDLRVVSGDYVKLASVTLRYLFSQQLCSRIKAKSGSIGFTGTNLFTLASKALKGQDPSQSGFTPSINMSIRPEYTLNVSFVF